MIRVLIQPLCANSLKNFDPIRRQIDSQYRWYPDAIFSALDQSCWPKILDTKGGECISSIAEKMNKSNVQGTWEHGNRQGQCRIEKNNNGVAFIDGNYQDNKMNGKVCKVLFPHNYADRHLSLGGGEIPGRYLVGRFLQGRDPAWLLSLLWLKRPAHLCRNAQKRKTLRHLLEGEAEAKKTPDQTKTANPGRFSIIMTSRQFDRLWEMHWRQERWKRWRFFSGDLLRRAERNDWQ